MPPPPPPWLTVQKKPMSNRVKKGYLCGSPDLVINNLHTCYSGFAIKFKSPKGNGVLSPDQSMMLRQYQKNGFKTLVSHDYDHIIEQIIEYFRDVRAFIKWLKEMRRCIAMNQLARHVRGTFYCGECDRVCTIGYMPQENVPRIHPSEVN